jgi:hypothetical protein
LPRDGKKEKRGIRKIKRPRKSEGVYFFVRVAEGSSPHLRYITEIIVVKTNFGRILLRAPTFLLYHSFAPVVKENLCLLTKFSLIYKKILLTLYKKSIEKRIFICYNVITKEVQSNENLKFQT